MVRPMVHSQKHYVQTSVGNVAGGAAESIVLVDAVEVQDKNTVNEVEEGSSIKAVYFEYWVKAGEASDLGAVNIAIYKNPGTGQTFTFAQMAAIGAAENKKNILYFSQGLINTLSGNATNVIKGWIKIPKSKQRFGLGDRLIMTISAAATIDVQRCGFATYKEYK